MRFSPARNIYQQYVDRRQTLRQNIQVLARKIEMGIDRPSNRRRDIQNDTSIGADPLTPSILGAYDFDFDAKDNIPDSTSMATLKPVSIKSKTGRPNLNLDWRSAKHQIVALQYCFERTRVAIEAARSGRPRAPSTRNGKNISPTAATIFSRRSTASRTVERVHDAVDAANREIRLKYEPNGFWWHFPVFREGCWLVGLRRGY